MDNERTVRFLLAADETSLKPTDEFVARTRQLLADELSASLNPGLGAVLTVDDHEPMGSTNREVSEEKTNNPRWSSGRLWLVACLIVAGLAGALVVQSIRTDDEPVVTEPADKAGGIPAITTPVSGLEDDPDAAAAFSVVDSAYEAHAMGDAEAWFAARSAGSDYPSEAIRERDKATAVARIGFGEELDVVECESFGLSDWPNILDSGAPATGFRFRCMTSASDNIMRLAGIDILQVTDWVVADGQIIGAISEDETADFEAFDQAFRTWLGRNHPDGNDYLTNGTNLTELLGFVEEFLAQSADYPKPADGP